MGSIILSKCSVLSEADYLPIRLTTANIREARYLAALQEQQSKEMNLRSHSIDQSPTLSMKNTTFSKYAEYAVRQCAGDIARITQPGEFHDYPDVGQVNVRWVGDIEDSLIIQDRDQGKLPMVFTASKDLTFADETIWLIGWGMTDLLRRNVVLINQFRENKSWGMFGSMRDHEQCAYPRTMLNPMKTLSKEFVNELYQLPLTRRQ